VLRIVELRRQLLQYSEVLSLKSNQCPRMQLLSLLRLSLKRPSLSYVCACQRLLPLCRCLGIKLAAGSLHLRGA
jgi:hypothetical protein